MPETKKETTFISFVCPECHQEIEASSDLCGQKVDCPACGIKLDVPAESARAEDIPEPLREALKSRTIRIELDAL